MSYDEQKEFFEKMVDECVAFEEDIMFERILFQNNLDKEFLAQLQLRWYKGLVALETMYLLTLEYATKFQKKYYVECENGVSLNTKQFALQNIHGRACQVFSEILCLLKNGFSDGAFARWRTLFELSVYAVFIYENDEDIAYKYIEQAKNDEREYQAEAEWAKGADCFKNKKEKITLKKILEACNFSPSDIDFWMQQYRMACKIVHASPQGTMKRLAISGIEGDIILAGRSPWGLHSLAEHAANSFYQITSAFFSTFADAEVLFATNVLRKWIDVICKHIYETVKISFPTVPDAKDIATDYEEYLRMQEDSIVQNESSDDLDM